jgi:hypothetical protein
MMLDGLDDVKLTKKERESSKVFALFYKNQNVPVGFDAYLHCPPTNTKCLFLHVTYDFTFVKGKSTVGHPTSDTYITTRAQILFSNEPLATLFNVRHDIFC